MPTPTTPSRGARARVRAEMTQLIADAARRQLGEVGGAALSVRAVAREVGLSSSAVFRYFPSRDALLTRLIVDGYTALGEAAEQAEAAVHDGTVAERWRAICHGVRDWAVAHPYEYALIFGSPIPGYDAPADTVAPASRVPTLLTALLVGGREGTDAAPDERTSPREGAAQGAASAPADRGAPADGSVPAPDGQIPIDAAFLESFAPLMQMVPAGVPADRALHGLMAWTYLFGAVSFEVFGHRHVAVRDPAAFFDHEMVRLAELLKIV